MIRLLLACFGFVLFAGLLQGQALESRPHWASGFYGNFAVGYGLVTHQPAPFHQPVGYRNGKVWYAGGGISFRNHWGIRAEISLYETRYGLAEFEQALQDRYPNYLVTSTRLSSDQDARLYSFAAGVSCAFPRERWNFQPELLLGVTKVFNFFETVHLKEQGTHQVYRMKYNTLNAGYTAPTLSVGGRAAWYAGWYWGLYADLRLQALHYRLKHHATNYDLVQQTWTEETVAQNRLAVGGALSVGIFLQIARWEPVVAGSGK